MELNATQTHSAQCVTTETSILTQLHQSQKTPLPGGTLPPAARQLGWFYLSQKIKCTGTHEPRTVLLTTGASCED